MGTILPNAPVNQRVSVRSVDAGRAAGN